MTSSTATQLPDIRLVVATGQDPDGASLFAFDNTLEQFAPFGLERSRFTNIHTTPTACARHLAVPCDSEELSALPISRLEAVDLRIATPAWTMQLSCQAR
uniref:Uncharacterized protein n=1 Tax=Mycena chlorophos TaxID=658473 RepID=A0ABQ0KXF9_MYCCL|nr:predicted protein [Mycena chlorophos]